MDQEERPGSLLVVRCRVRGSEPERWRRLELRADLGLASVYSLVARSLDQQAASYDGGTVTELLGRVLAVPGDTVVVETGGEVLDVMLERRRPRLPGDRAVTCTDGSDLDAISRHRLTDRLDDAPLLLPATIPSAVRDLLDRLAGHDEAQVWASAALGLSAAGSVGLPRQARAVRGFTHALRHVGEGGLSLTRAGWLRRGDVLALAAELPTAADWSGPMGREKQSLPVLVFRQSLMGAGLVDRRRGRLVLTDAGRRCSEDPEECWVHLCDYLARDGSAPDAVLLALLWVAGSPQQPVPHGLLDLTLRRLGSSAEAAVDPAALGVLNVLRNVAARPMRISEWSRDLFSEEAAALASGALRRAGPWPG